MSSVTLKSRDVAGTAAFELALQYMLIRHDRSYHFVQLLTAVFSVIFACELFLLTVVSLPLPIFVAPQRPLAAKLERASSPMLTLLSLTVLLLLRASKKRFIIEPGDQTMERVNHEVLEPCLGLKFNVDDGKLYSDQRCSSISSTEGFYALRYSSEQNN